MSAKVKPVPDGYAAPTPYLVVSNAAAAIDFYKKAFGAKEIMRMPGPDGKIGHADLAMGGGHLMLADESPERGHRAPGSFGGSPVGLVLYVDDVDRIVKQAIAAGATLTFPVADQFYGDRMGGLTDPFGHTWHVMTHIEDVSNEEMTRRAAAQAAQPVQA